MSKAASPYNGGKGGRAAPTPAWQAQHVLGGGGVSPAAASSSPGSGHSSNRTPGPGSPTSHQARARTPAYASPGSPPAPHAGSTPTRAARRRSASPTKGAGGGGGVGPYSHLAPMSEAAYRLACARSSEHRDQELAWYWHLYRLRTAKGAIDAKQPFSMSVRRDPAAAARHSKAKTEAVFRQAEIDAANLALVSRIKGQRSAYAYNTDQPSAANSPLVREHRLRAEEQDARHGTSTARTGGSSGLHFQSRASRNEQRKIEMDNAALLRSLKHINTAPGPYNHAKLAAEISQHEHLVRKRLPRVMHAHPRHLLASASATQLSVPPIHYSVIAARATSPSRGSSNGSGMSGGGRGFASTLNSPPRRLASPLIPSPNRENHWRDYAAARGLTPSASSPALQDSAPSSARSNGQGSLAPSPHQQQLQRRRSGRERSEIDSLTMQGLLDTVAGLDVQDDHAEHGEDDEQRQELDPYRHSQPSSRPHSASPSNALPLPRLEPLELKGALSRTHVTVDGLACTVVAEVDEDARRHGATPKSLQVTCYPDACPSSPLALLVSLEALEHLLPSSIGGMVAPPYEDFTSLIYAIAPRLYFPSTDAVSASAQPDGAASSLSVPAAFAMHLEADFVPSASAAPSPSLRPASAARSKASSRPSSAVAPHPSSAALPSAPQPVPAAVPASSSASRPSSSSAASAAHAGSPTVPGAGSSDPLPPPSSAAEPGPVSDEPLDGEPQSDHAEDAEAEVDTDAELEAAESADAFPVHKACV